MSDKARDEGLTMEPGDAAGMSSFSWQQCDDGIAITGCVDPAEYLRIPDLINGQPVTEIAEEAFTYTDIKRICLPSTLKRIGRAAFGFCFDLEEILLPAGLVRLDGTAFLCSGIQALHLPATIKEITSPASLDMALITDPASSVFLADGTGLYHRENETSPFTELLSVYTDKETDYTIREGIQRIPSDAFRNIHAPIRLLLPKSLKQMDPQALHPFYTGGGKGLLKELKIHPDNPVFYMDQNGLWQQNEKGIRLIRWLGGSEALLPDSVTDIASYAMSESDFQLVCIPQECTVEPGAFRNARIHFLDLGDRFRMPEGTVENHNLITKIFSGGRADISTYDDVLLQGYLSFERLQMCLERIAHQSITKERREELQHRLLQSGAQVVKLCLDENAVSVFRKWLQVPGHNSSTLLAAVDELNLYKGANQTAAREMLAALLEVKGSGDEASFAEDSLFDL